MNTVLIWYMTVGHISSSLNITQPVLLRHSLLEETEQQSTHGSAICLFLLLCDVWKTQTKCAWGDHPYMNNSAPCQRTRWRLSEAWNCRVLSAWRCPPLLQSHPSPPGQRGAQHPPPALSFQLLPPKV